MGKTIIITPAYTHVDDRTERAVQATGLPWVRLYRNSDLPKARSVLIEKALATDAERVLFLDADVVPSPAALKWLAETDEITPAKAMWGRYPQRDGRRWSFEPIDHQEALSARVGNFFHLEWGGLGLACVHRRSLERVGTALKYVEHVGEVKWRPFCVPMVVGNDYLADDRALCNRLRRAGTVLRCRADLVAGHATVQVVTGLSPLSEPEGGTDKPATAPASAKDSPTARKPRRAPRRTAAKSAGSRSSKKAPKSGKAAARKKRAAARA